MLNAILYCLTVFIWGTTWFVITFQLGEVPVVQSVFYRFLLAAITINIILILLGKIKLYNLKTHLFFILIGIFLFSANYVLFYYAQNYITSGLVAVIFSIMIIFNIVNNMIFFKEKSEVKVIIGAVIGLMGIGLLFYKDLVELDFSLEGLGAIFICIIASYFASLGNTTSKKLNRMGVDVIDSIAWGMIYGTILLGIISLSLFYPLKFSFTFPYITSLIILAIIGSLVAFWSYLTLINRIGIDKAVYASVLFPAIALILSYYYEDLEWDNLRTCGLILVTIGNVIVLMKINIITNALVNLRPAPKN